MRTFLLSITFLIISAYLIWSYQSFFEADSFKLFFFDVGQGDSALIITPGGQTILIDGGPDRKVLRALGEALPFWRRKIDLLVITHAHDDHISGLVEVSRRYQINNVLYNNLNFETPVLSALIETFKDNKIHLTKAVPKMILKFDNGCLYQF